MSFYSRLRAKYFVVVADRASRYLQMFKGKEEMARPEIDWAIKTLGREDRVIWYLRQIKTHPISESLKEQLNHFMGMAKTVKSIEDYKFNPNDPEQKILNELSVLEQRTKEQYEETSHLVPQDGVKVLDLGNKWAWWDLQKGYSVDEANAMGHCGNANHHDGDTILSLREEKKVGSQVAYEPHCTFIINSGTLGEMKGRANEKPVKKYHKAIIALLESPIVKHVMGGGYQNKAKGHVNFSLDDLTDGEREHLLKLKPHLDPMRLTTLSDLEKVKIPGKHYPMFKEKNDAVALGVEFGLSANSPDSKGNLKKMENHLDEALKDYSALNNHKLISALSHYSTNDGILEKIALFDFTSKTDIAIPTRRRHGTGSPSEIAASRIKDQKTLMEIAEKSEKNSVIETVLESLDEKNIEKLAETNAKIRPLAIQYIHNEALLKKLYEEDDNLGVKSHAVNNIEDQKFLEKVAKDKFEDRSGNYTPDQVAITKIKDPKFLLDLIDSGDHQKRMYAYWSLPDKDLIDLCNKRPELIKEVLSHAKAARSLKFLSRCLKEIKNDDTKKSIIEHAKSKEHTPILIEAVTNPELATAVRIFAVGKLYGKDIYANYDSLIKVLKTDKDERVLLSLIFQFNDFMSSSLYSQDQKLLDQRRELKDIMRDLATKSPYPSVRLAAYHKASDKEKVVKQLVFDEDIAEDSRLDLIRYNRDRFELSFDEFKKLPYSSQREYINRVGGPVDDDYMTGAGKTIPFLDKIENPELFGAIAHTVSHLFARQKSKIANAKKQLTKLFNSPARREIVRMVGKSLPKLIDGDIFKKLPWFQELYLKALSDPYTELSVKRAIMNLLYGTQDGDTYDKSAPTKYIKTETGKLFLSKIQ